jgi:hypothetical protein
MIIQILLISLLALFFLYFVRVSAGIKARAWQKIIVLLLPLLGIVSVIWPSFLDAMAKLVGIGRGADLVLYFLIVVFLFFSARVYFKFREISTKQDKIISKIAMLEKEMEE